MSDIWQNIRILPDIPHHYVDKGVLDETEEHEEGAGRHKHINSLNILENCYDNS